MCERLQFPQVLTLCLSYYQHLPSSPTTFRFIRCNKLNSPRSNSLIHLVPSTSRWRVDSQTSRFISTELSWGIPFPLSTWCPRISPLTLVFSLSLHRHPYLYIPLRLDLFLFDIINNIEEDLVCGSWPLSTSVASTCFKWRSYRFIFSITVKVIVV